MNMPVYVAPVQDVAATIIRVGDALLWAWGEAKRNGWLERLLQASVAAISEDGTPRAPGTHGDPTLARLMSCESEQEYESKKNRAAFMVECEMAHWRKDKHTRLWTEVAEAYYAGPLGTTNAVVSRQFKVSERTIEGIRSQMRRVLVVAARRS